MDGPHIEHRGVAPDDGRRGHEPQPVVFEVHDLAVYYGEFRAVREVNLDDPRERDHGLHRTVGVRQVDRAALLRPHERPDRVGARSRARSCTTGSTCTARNVDPVEVRRRVGMVFQKPNPFPKSIYDNLAFGPRLNGIKKKSELDDIVEQSLRRRRVVGRGQGSPQVVGARAVGRSAAAAVHRPLRRRRTRRDPDGRAVLGARPDRHCHASRS